MPKPSINYKKCTSCKNCLELCPMNCFEEKDGKIIVTKPKECIGCMACVVQCDPKAIKIMEED